jgi:flagellar biogenesis protein FliO
MSATSWAGLGIRLAAVFVLMWLVLLTLRRVQRGKRGGRLAPRQQQQRAIEIIDRQSLSRSASIYVIRIAGRDLVVGVTDQRMERLGLFAAEDELETVDLRAAEQGSSAGLLDRLRDKTLR